MSNFLVTGGAGFIGSNLAECLLEKGHNVRILDNFSTGKQENLEGFNKFPEILKADIRDFQAAKEAMEGIDCCFHEAALGSVTRSIENPRNSIEVNVKGTLNILLAARATGNAKIIYASSSSIYGSNPQLPRRETLIPEPVSPYALSKLIAEYYCILFHRQFSVPTVILRYFNVFGKRQDAGSPYSAVIPKFLKALHNKTQPVIYGDGSQTRDFTHIDNVIDANLEAWNNDKVAGEVFNIGCGKETSINKLLSVLCDITGIEVSPVHKKGRKGDPKQSRAEIVKAKTMMGYQPKVTLIEGLKKVIEQ